MKDKITKIKIFLSILAVIGFGTGCNDNQNQLDEDNNDLGVSLVHTTNPSINQLPIGLKKKLLPKKKFQM